MADQQSHDNAHELAGESFPPPPPPGPPPAQTTGHPPTQSAQQPAQPYFPPPPGQPESLAQHVPPPGQHSVEQQQFAPPPAQQTSQAQQFPPGQQTSHAQVPPTDSHTQQQYHIPAYDPAHPSPAPPLDAPTASGVPQETEQHPTKKSWSDRFAQLGSKAAAPINSIAHKLGSQSFLPETLDKECDKAAAILKSFCKKGVYADPAAAPTSTHPSATESSGAVIDPTKEKPKNRVLVTIPPKVISKAVGLAIFTTLRAGFQVSGATGSGILIARLPDGSWSPPSGIQVHSVGGGFQIGLDIYDCVCVINSKEALAAFMNTRVSLGSDLAVVAGPYGAGGAVDFGAAVERDRGREDNHSATLQPGPDEKAKRRSLSASAFKPVFSYVKSRGFYAGVQVDGTVVVERKDANAAFYGAPLSVHQILGGQVQQHTAADRWPSGARELLATLKGAEDRPAENTAPPAHAGVADAELPAYVDDGTHAHVSDTKYA